MIDGAGVGDGTYGITATGDSAGSNT